MKIILLFILNILLTAFVSCTNSTPQESVVVIDLDKDVQKTIKYSSFVDSISYIPLETTDSCLIGHVKDIQIADSFIFVLDKKQPIIFIFDRYGHYLSKIDRRGQGPGEYGWIVQFYYNENRKSISVCTASGSCKIIEYDLQGNLINEFSNNYFVGDLYQFDNGDYLVSRIGRIDKPLSAVLICDSKGNIKKELLQRDTTYAIDCSDQWELEVFDNTINFMSPLLNNIVYNYNKEVLSKTVSFNFLPAPTKDFYTKKPDVSGLGPHYLRTIYKESKNWLYFAFSSNSKGLRILLYNKLTGEYQISQDTENDIDGNGFIAQTSASENNTFIYCIEDEKDNNPIIQILHLK